MKLFLKIFILAVILITTTGFSVQKTDLQKLDILKNVNTQVKSELTKDLNFGKIPLYFISNKGQVDKQAEFYARASRYTLWMTKEGLVFDSFKKQKTEHEGKKFEKKRNSKIINIKTEMNHAKKTSRDVSSMVFVGADKKVKLTAIDFAKLKVNYFKGSDKSKWLKKISTSKAVLYTGIYKNINMKVYGIEKQIEYDWIVKPDGDPSSIKFQYKDVKGTRIDKAGNLLIKTKFGELIHKKPVSYQLINKKKIPVKADFIKLKNNTYAFKVGDYDKCKELIIDPVVLAYSTYLGGDDWDQGNSIAVDSSGCAYVIGETSSKDFPTKNPYMTYPGGVFITKFSSDGSSLEYSTYLGGDGWDQGNSISVDNRGCAYITGVTRSIDFPTQNPYMTDPGDDEKDAFVVKLSSNGSSLEYSTYLGGEYEDEGHGVVVDNSGCAYITGSTNSKDFPTKNPYMAKPWMFSDAFVVKLSPDGNSLEYSTYLGGRSIDKGIAIAIDQKGCAYITGTTWSEDFPTKNPYMTFPGNYNDNSFVTKLSSNGRSLEYSTYLGGSENDKVNGIAVDINGCAYVIGTTTSTDFPTKNPYMTYPGDYSNAFVTKLSSAGSSLEYSTYLGGNSFEVGSDIAVDINGCAYVTGTTDSTDFPTLNPFMTYISHASGYDNAYVTKLSSDGASLEYSTYLGGSDWDSGYGIAVDSSGCVYVTGETFSRNFPTKNSYMTDPDGYIHEAFVTKLSIYRLELSGKRKTESAWIIKKEYGDVKISVLNPFEGNHILKIQRKKDDGEFQDIEELNSSEISGSEYLFKDKFLERGSSYTYRVRTLDSFGNYIIISNMLNL